MHPHAGERREPETHRDKDKERLDLSRGRPRGAWAETGGGVNEQIGHALFDLGILHV